MLNPRTGRTEPVIDLPPWTPQTPPIYDISKSYLENALNGPVFKGVIPPRALPSKEHWIDFLGFKVASRIGVPAGPLLNSKWIGFAAAFGYDILCYKTIRSFEYLGHSVPNIIYVDAKQPLDVHKLPLHLVESSGPPRDLTSIGITNSFGMPSRPPESLREDIPLAQSSLREGQVMIVSIVGTPPCALQPQPFIDNFIDTASLAKECGAQIVEANFSCPNVSTGEGCLYYNPDAVYSISKKLVQVLGSIPLILKVGVFPDDVMMEKTFLAAAKAGVRAISGINTISMKVLKANGQLALGPQRATSGICGSPIREAALEFIRKAHGINKKHHLGLTLIATGGITLPEHFNEFLEYAEAAMTATGMMWDPYLALRYAI